MIQENIDRISTTNEVHKATILELLETVLGSPPISDIIIAPKKGIKIISDKIGQLVINIHLKILENAS